MKKNKISKLDQANSDVSEELRQIYADAQKEGIWIREWKGNLAAAGRISRIRALEKRLGVDIDISELSLGDCVEWAYPGTGKTREEACRDAVNSLKASSKKKKNES